MTDLPGGQRPEQPEGPYSPPPADPGGDPASAPPPSSRKGKRILIGLLGVAVALAVSFGIRAVVAEATGDLSTASVGDCVNEAALPDDIKVVDCDSEDAFMTVIGKNTDWTESDFEMASMQEVCEGFSSSQNAGAIWYGDDSSDGSGSGDVYCLEPLG